MRSTSVALAVAVALGLAATVVAPASALAQDARPDLMASPAYLGVVEPEQRAVVPVVVENKGDATRQPVSVKIMIAQGFADVTVRGAFGQQWTCGEADVGKYSGVITITCTTNGLEADSHKAVLVTGTAHELSDVWMIATADPDDQVEESNETNNRGKQNLGPYPVVYAPEYQD